jgi:hypothetical protein
MAASPHASVEPKRRLYGPIHRNIFYKKLEEGLSGQIDQILYRVGVSAKAFYGYFIERGWMAMGRSRRLRLHGAQAGHAQRGTTGGRKIEGRPFVGPAFDQLKPELERIIAEKIAEAVRALGR